MVSERLKDWSEEMTPRHSKYATLPKTIVYYRDGVSESMYAEVKKVELKAIRDAFGAVVKEYTRAKKINQSAPQIPKIIAIICGKRHNVRFYPAHDREADVYQNCGPGTTVDNVVTSPYYQDFYLQSHSALKGTARPAHYFVIENESNEPVQKLRKMVSPFTPFVLLLIQKNFLRKLTRSQPPDPRAMLHLCPRPRRGLLRRTRLLR